MSPSQIIVLATPVFFVLIAIEFLYGLRQQRKGTGRNTYRLNDAINSISLGMLSQISAVFTGVLRVGLYTAVYATLSVVPLDVAHAFWTTLPGWLLALVFYDFCYYWLHRMGHESAVLWAAHVVHHQSQDYNLSTALRQTSSGALLGWVFYLPMAVTGVPPLVFGVVGLVDLLYQFWVHTEQVGKLGWFDRWFCSPSNHRAHHAVNDAYVDKNYGGILILWDRLFGSFVEEDDANPCVYGTRSPLNSWDPLWANAQTYWDIAQDSWHAKSFGDKLRVWWKPPGWRPADVAARYPKPAFEIQQRQLYHPPVSRGVLWLGGVQFALLLGGVMGFLWGADQATLATNAAELAALTVGLWTVGGVLQGRLSVLEALLIESAVLATLTLAFRLVDLHHVFKPLTMVIALILVAYSAYPVSSKRPFYSSFDRHLSMALLASLAGDCFLMFDGYFIPGLVAFLTGHLLYIARFKQGVGMFPSRWALALTLSIGAVMYTVLWLGGLPPALRGPVAAYVVVIALMVAQALGRTGVRRDKASTLIAAGAVFFMLSDSLLAVNRFVTPLNLGGVDAGLWVLSTYYVAQILILMGCLDEGNEGRCAKEPQKQQGQ